MLTMQVKHAVHKSNAPPLKYNMLACCIALREELNSLEEAANVNKEKANELDKVINQLETSIAKYKQVC